MSTIEPIPTGEEPSVATPTPTPDVPPMPAAEDTTEVEAQARLQGWRPLDEFNKAPDQWKSAEDFLAVAEESMPVLRERMREMANQVKEIPGIKAALEMSKMERAQALREQREELTQEYDAKMRVAAETGDMGEFDRLSAEKERRTKAPETTVDAVEHPAVTAFKADNVWFGTNEEMTDFAHSSCNVIENQHPTWDQETVMKRLGVIMQKAYPQEYPSVAPTVEGGGNRPAAKGKAKNFASMPADYRAGFDQSVAHGLVADTDDDRKKFAEIYWAEQGEAS